ncbi:MAG: DUF3108 domain-containing protein [Desulfobacteraceae bacterium]|nr:MAG: DUF3108 domain-containing protein [Desulfobacteraceae bacterium]
MRQQWKHIGTAMVMIGLMIFSVQAGENHPFKPGEKLFFKVYWTVVQAGEATLEIMPLAEQSGVTAYHFVMTVKTYPFVDAFYKVRDRYESYADVGMNHALLYKKKQEGKKKRDITVIFDWVKPEAVYTENGDKLPPVALLPGSFDPLSVFYAFRLAELSENKELTVSVSDGKKCAEGKARVVKKEKVKVADTEYETFLVEPELKDIGGVFQKSPDAKLQIWVTADERRLPVMIKSKVSVGHFKVELIGIEIPQ